MNWQGAVNMSGETEQISARLRAAHDAGGFGGVCLVGRKDRIVYRGEWGMADRARNAPNRLSVPFPICSITKQFTSLLVMQQVAAGRLDVDGRVAEYLPGFRGGLDEGITLRHLLMHTSGLPQWDKIPGILTSTDARYADGGYIWRTYGKWALLSKPGETFRYNNMDYLVLASVLEAVTKRSYANLLSEQIVRPLNLRQTGLINFFNPRRVVGYLKRGSGFVPETPPYHLPNWGAAGAMYSTVDDLWTWNRALDTDRLLPRRFREIMFTPDATKGYTALGTWVYGYHAYGKKTPTLYERQGAIGGLACQNLRVPEDEISIILLANVDTADLAAYTGKSLTCDLLRILYGEAGGRGQ